MVADAFPRTEALVKAAADALIGKTIDKGRIYLHSVIGSGSFGVVFLGYGPRETPSGELRPFAIKCLRRPTDDRQRNIIEREIRHHRIVSSHDSIVTLHNVLEDDTWYYVVLDYCPEGDLFHEIVQEQRFYGNDYLIKDAFLQLLDAVEHCHDKSIFHRDLKPENVLCQQSGQKMLLTDFGLSTTVSWSSEFGCGSGYYMSPEVHGLSRMPYSAAQADIWSLGVILVNLVTGRNPWKRALPGDSVYDFFLRDSDALGKVLPISPEVNTLLKRIFVQPDRRLSIPQIRETVLGIDRFLRCDSPTTVQSWQDTLDKDRQAVHHRLRKQPVPHVPPSTLPEAIETRPVAASREGHHRHMSHFLGLFVHHERPQETAQDDDGSSLPVPTDVEEPSKDPPYSAPGPHGPQGVPLTFSWMTGHSFKPPQELELPRHAPVVEEFAPKQTGNPLIDTDLPIIYPKEGDVGITINTLELSCFPSIRHHERGWTKEASFGASDVRRTGATPIDGPPEILVDCVDDDALDQDAYPATTNDPSDSSESETTPSPVTPPHTTHEFQDVPAGSTLHSLTPSQFQHRFVIRETIRTGSDAGSSSSSSSGSELEEDEKGPVRHKMWGWIHSKSKKAHQT